MYTRHVQVENGVCLVADPVQAQMLPPVEVWARRCGAEQDAPYGASGGMGGAERDEELRTSKQESKRKKRKNPRDLQDLEPSWHPNLISSPTSAFLVYLCIK